MRYEFKNHPVAYGDGEILVTGYADYDILFSGFGATFTKVRITDYKFKKEEKNGIEKGLTDSDKKILEKELLNTLNENAELCEYLDSDDANGF